VTALTASPAPTLNIISVMEGTSDTTLSGLLSICNTFAPGISKFYRIGKGGGRYPEGGK
jgi:hypothetical protein